MIAGQQVPQKTRNEPEQLVAGRSIAKKISQGLMYMDLYDSIDHFWCVLFTTGYLAQRSRLERDIYQLAIPNWEIRQIFIDQILEWFQTEARKDTPKLEAFCAAFSRGDAEAAEEQFNAYLRKNKKGNYKRGKKFHFFLSFFFILCYSKFNKATFRAKKVVLT